MGAMESMRAVVRNRSLVRVQGAMLAAGLADSGFFTAVTVWAYEASGAHAVGVFTAATFAAGAVVAPIAAVVVDRLPRRTALLAMDTLRLALVVAAAACLVLPTPLATLTLAGVLGVLAAPARSAHRAWLPALAESPEELTAANATASTMESSSILVGPAAAALLLAATDVTTTLLVLVLGYAASLLLVVGVRGPRPATPARPAPGGSGPSLVQELGAGFALLLGDRALRAVTGQVCAQTFVAGANRVLLVVLAAEVLGTGSAGVGLLMAVMGGCAVVGGLLALARVPLGRVGRDLGLGVALWGLALLPVAVVATPAAVLVAVVLLGVANPLVDVNLDTALQRLAPDHVLARVFGALDALYVATAALGALVVPFLLDAVGLRATLVLVSVPALMAFVVSRGRMVALDARLGEPPTAALLRGIPWFARLAPATIEGLARDLRAEPVAEGDVVVAQGDVGSDFFVIAEGRVEVVQDGRVLREQGPGEYFGEIALLRDVPRTATVTTLEPTVLQRLSRTDFLHALGDGAREEAHRAAVARMSGRV